METSILLKTRFVIKLVTVCVFTIVVYKETLVRDVNTGVCVYQSLTPRNIPESFENGMEHIYDNFHLTCVL